ncbi:myotilin isoform X2 [Ascaphus truei]|uniref:myotilin isoform X2 n=1 Tax=Ascaphus truei TaxID=8439 RepID=UPI003F5A8A07
MYQPTMFNYERPKHFILSQSTCPVQSTPLRQTATTFISIQPQKSSILIKPQSCNELIQSPSYPLSFPGSDAPPSCSSYKETEPLGLLPLTQSSSNSLSRQDTSFQFKQPPVTFLSSVLPSNNDYSSSKANSTDYPKSVIKKVSKPIHQISEREIQGTKDALIQDLERKLKCKDNIQHNGNQRLTYEEKMARRLLGPQNAAFVFENKTTENVQDLQQIPDNTRRQNHHSQTRNQSSSCGGDNNQRSIQEKFFPPRFLQVPEDLVVEEGRFCRIDFKVRGLPAPDVSWYLNGILVEADEFHKMILSEKDVHSFIFEVVRVCDAGVYECIASNRAGETTFTLKLDVLAQEHRRPPYFIHKPAATRTFEGDTVKMECQVFAMPPPKILLKKNNEMLEYNTNRIRSW